MTSLESPEIVSKPSTILDMRITVLLILAARTPNLRVLDESFFDLRLFQLARQKP